jgi:hypothetical protein
MAVAPVSMVSFWAGMVRLPGRAGVPAALRRRDNSPLTLKRKLGTIDATPRPALPLDFPRGLTHAGRRKDLAMSDTPPRHRDVYTLVVQVGRKSGDGLPEGATGAGLVCYASGVDEAEAVRETVAVLRRADMAPLDVTGYGTAEERREQGHEIDPEERVLMERALAENAVIVAQVTPFED